MDLATQKERIATEIIASLSLAEQEDTVRRYVRRVINMILIVCNRADIPIQLESVAERMAEDMLRVDGFIQVEKAVTGITRGDTTIRYHDGSGTALANAEAYLRDYKHLLYAYRKMKLPEDRP